MAALASNTPWSGPPVRHYTMTNANTTTTIQHEYNGKRNGYKITTTTHSSTTLLGQDLPLTTTQWRMTTQHDYNTTRIQRQTQRLQKHKHSTHQHTTWSGPPARHYTMTNDNTTQLQYNTNTTANATATKSQLQHSSRTQLGRDLPLVTTQ